MSFEITSFRPDRLTLIDRLQAVLAEYLAANRGFARSRQWHVEHVSMAVAGAIKSAVESGEPLTATNTYSGETVRVLRLAEVEDVAPDQIDMWLDVEPEGSVRFSLTFNP